MAGQGDHRDRPSERCGDRGHHRFLLGEVEARLDEVKSALPLEVIAKTGDQETVTQRGGPVWAEFEDRGRGGVWREGRRATAIVGVWSDVLERTYEL